MTVGTLVKGVFSTFEVETGPCKLTVLLISLTAESTQVLTGTCAVETTGGIGALGAEAAVEAGFGYRAASALP